MVRELLILESGAVMLTITPPEEEDEDEDASMVDSDSGGDETPKNEGGGDHALSKIERTKRRALRASRDTDGAGTSTDAGFSSPPPSPPSEPSDGGDIEMGSGVGISAPAASQQEVHKPTISPKGSQKPSRPPSGNLMSRVQSSVKVLPPEAPGVHGDAAEEAAPDKAVVLEGVLVPTLLAPEEMAGGGD